MNKRQKDIPIIKTFIYDGNYYFYDTYTNRLLKISKEHFAEISFLQKIGIKAYKESKRKNKEYKDIMLLLDKGMLKSIFIEQIEHSETEYAHFFVDRCINDITLQVTKDCNFKCRYCMFANNNNIGRTHEKLNMTWEVAKRSIDFLYEHSKDAETLTIAFYGAFLLSNK